MIRIVYGLVFWSQGSLDRDDAGLDAGMQAPKTLTVLRLQSELQAAHSWTHQSLRALAGGHQVVGRIAAFEPSPYFAS
jgi:hypothetical protein